MRERIFDSKFINFKIKNLNNFHENLQKEFIEKTKGFSGRDIDEFVKNLKLSKPDEDFKKQDFLEELHNTETKYKDNFRRIMENSIDEIKIPEKIELVGYEDIIQELQKECKYITYDLKTKKNYEEFEIKMKRGSILYGPPGNGKTELASYIANKNNFYLIKILSKSFASLSFENSLKKIKEIFENTIKLANITSKSGILLFFDEIDTLIGNGLDPLVRGTLLNYLQDEKGIRHYTSKIMFLGATNFFESLDEASIRSGRIDRKIYIGNPEIDSYLKFFENLWKNDESVSLDLDLNSNIFRRLLNKFILFNFETKQGLERMFPISLNDYTDIEEIRKKRKEFLEKSEENKIKEIREKNINLYSISDIKNLAESIKTFSFENNKISSDGKKIIINEDICKQFISEIYNI